MGQKVHPYGLRLGIVNNWQSRWFSRHQYAKWLLEDVKIRKFIQSQLTNAGLARIEIERKSQKIRIILHTARPGVIIGRRGAEIDRLRDEIERLTQKNLTIDIREIKIPQMEAALVAENIALQLERRVSFRRAVKKSVQQTMDNGAGGVKVIVRGRLGGGEIARTERHMVGKVPLHTLRAIIDYALREAHTTYGRIGVKVWIYKGEMLGPMQLEETSADAHMEASRASRQSAPPAPTPAPAAPAALAAPASTES